MASSQLVDDGRKCPGCGERGHLDERMIEQTDERLPVLLYLCSTEGCRVREFFRSQDTGGEARGE